MVKWNVGANKGRATDLCDLKKAWGANQNGQKARGRDPDRAGRRCTAGRRLSWNGLEAGGGTGDHQWRTALFPRAEIPHVETLHPALS